MHLTDLTLLSFFGILFAHFLALGLLLYVFGVLDFWQARLLCCLFPVVDAKDSQIVSFFRPILWDRIITWIWVLLDLDFSHLMFCSPSLWFLVGYHCVRPRWPCFSSDWSHHRILEAILWESLSHLSYLLPSFGRSW